MARSLILLAATSLLATVSAQGKEWEQCGGQGWSAPTTCESGLSCVFVNDWYSQCLKVTGGSSMTTSEESTTTSTLPTSTTLVISTTSSVDVQSTTQASSTTSDTVTTTGAIVGSKATGIKVRLIPSQLNGWKDEDWNLWGVVLGTNASTTIGSIDLSLSAGTGNLAGTQYKVMQYTFLPSLGQRLLGAGITTESQDGVPITLILKGLSAGNHSILVFHNAWDNLKSVASLSVSINGKSVITNHTQSIRVNNVWDAASTYLTFSVSDTSQPVSIVFTPDSGGNKRVHINGFELDVADIDNTASFPEPPHKEEHIGQGSTTGVTASWKPPKNVVSAKYNVYISENTQSAWVLKSSEQTDTTYTFTGLSNFPIYWWRVDTIDASGNVYQGRVWKFRIAQLAFPGAEGWGRFARGGRGGKVVKVTSLADSGPGTLRNALTVETGPRTVIFDVGGVITLNSRITINTEFITLAGQTAPGKGIVIQGWPIGLSGAVDVIFRHIRVRPGKVSGGTVDGMGMQGSNHAIFDRCSTGWSIDESFSSRGAFNITLQRSMLSEPLNIAGHQNYPNGTAHGYAASIGGDVGSFHHNLIAHAEGRSWSMAGGLDYAAVHAGRLDIRNNVVYNFGKRVNDGGTRLANFVGNLYKQGPSSKLKYAFAATYEGPFGPQQYHCAGNSMPGLFSDTSIQYVENGTSTPIACWADVRLNPPPTFQKFFPQPFFESYVSTQSSTEAYKRVLSDSGAQYPVLDDHDKRIISETFNGTTTYTGSVGNSKGIIDNPSDVGGLESFPTTTRPSSWDANNDGIADWWDGSTGGAGYTPLEGYLNFMADPHAFVAPGETVSIALAQWAAGFVNPTFAVSGAQKGTVSVSGSTATYVAGSIAGIDSFTLSIMDSEGSTWDRQVGVAIFSDA